MQASRFFYAHVAERSMVAYGAPPRCGKQGDLLVRLNCIREEGAAVHTGKEASFQRAFPEAPLL